MSLLSELKRFKRTDKINMHIPGHKNGRGLEFALKKSAFKIDVTELEGTDNLQNPNGIIKTAQENCAKIFGAEETMFLTEGSSLGIRASVIGCAGRGDKLLVDRTCHKSVISAIALCGAEPIYISPHFDEKRGLYLGILADDVTRAISSNPDIKGAVITSPSYYGVCSDIKAIADILHKSGKFLIVDEAHGAHFVFSKMLPDTALSAGADICVQSAHKTLPALGQASYLHIGKGAMIDRVRLMHVLRMLQTTSPSYLLMSSLDSAGIYMQFRGSRKLEKLITEIERLKAEVVNSTRLRFADSAGLGVPQDETRLVVDFMPVKISGKTAEEILIRDYGIYPEMADGRYVVFIPSIANKLSDIRRLCRALICIGEKRYINDTARNNIPLPDIEAVILPEKALYADFETLPVDQCDGRLSAAVVSAFPPGAAVIVPGQRIDRCAVCYIKKNDIVAKIDVLK